MFKEMHETIKLKYEISSSKCKIRNECDYANKTRFRQY